MKWERIDGQVLIPVETLNRLSAEYAMFEAKITFFAYFLFND